MKRLFDDPTLRIVLFDLRDVLTTSPEYPDEEQPGGDLPILPLP